MQRQRRDLNVAISHSQTIPNQRGAAFFFFFLPAASPHYEDPRFAAFCAACASTRASYPFMTIGLLRTVLAIASSGKPDLTYTETANLTGLDYNSAIYQIAQLADGRGGQPGLGLVTLSALDTFGKRSLSLSGAAKGLIQAFLAPADSGKDFAQGLWPVDGPVRALGIASEKLSALSLGTLTVFLEVARLQKKFAYEGLAARSMIATLKINNLPRHLAILASGLQGRPGHNLITLLPHGSDGRKKLPELTASGHELLSRMAASLVDEPVVAPKRPKPQILEGLDSPDKVADLDDDAFTEIVFPDFSDSSSSSNTESRKGAEGT